MMMQGRKALHAEVGRPLGTWYGHRVLLSLRLSNFRCFRSAELRLSPLTVLVGPNASGKTSLLRALARREIENPRDAWQQNAKLPVSLTWGIEGNQPVHLESKGRGTSVTAPIETMGLGQYLRLDARTMRNPALVQEEPLLNENGSNLVNVVATMPRRQQEQLASDLARLVPVFQDVATRPLHGGSHRLVFQDRWNGSLWYEPSEVSDGTLFALGLLALQYQSSPVHLVAIDDPEHGLHPYLLGEMMAIFRKLSHGEGGGRPIQVVLATQSAELLEFVEPAEVRFLSRSDDGSVVVEEAPTSSESWRDAYDVHQKSLASLWLSGTLGGVPTG